MKISPILLFSICAFLFSCAQEEKALPEPSSELMYFPPLNSSNWDRQSPESLNWSLDKLPDLYDFLSSNNTRGFILLKNGKIVLEKYWGNNLQNTASFDQNSAWYWASAGKALTALLVGIAQEEGLLDIQDKTSDYLGENWSSLEPAQEAQIRIIHQLTMSSGLDYEISDRDCTLPACLEYKASPGSQWFYHNAPYTLLEEVVANASGLSYNQYTQLKVEDLIGMQGTWIKSNFNNVYYSTLRDAARFGLLLQNKGQWGDTKVLEDQGFLEAMRTPSQSMNPSYGYLLWLNGQNSIIYPGLASSFNLSLSPNAPLDLYAAMGKNGQFIDVIPSQNLVLIRMGEAPDDSLVPILFHDQMWEYLNEILP